MNSSKVTWCYSLLHNIIVNNLLMVCDVHVLAAPTPTTFSAATDTLSYLGGGFEGGSKVWLHLPAVHVVMFTLSVDTTEPEWKLIWYCVMFPLGP